MPEGKNPRKNVTAPTASTQTPSTSSSAPQSSKTNTLAIVAIVFALFVPLIGLILGIVALSQIKKRGEGGRGLAIASIVVSVVIMIMQIVFVALFWGTIFALKNKGVDVTNGTINVKNQEGETFSIGNTKIPEEFPSDVPIYPGAKVSAASKYDDNRYTVVISSVDEFNKVSDYYQRELKAKGWTTGENTASFNFESGSLSTFEKDNQTLLVTISKPTSSTKETVVSLTVGLTNK